MCEGEPGRMTSEAFTSNSPGMYTAAVCRKEVRRQKINQERDVLCRSVYKQSGTMSAEKEWGQKITVLTLDCVHIQPNHFHQCT